MWFSGILGIVRHHYLMERVTNIMIIEGVVNPPSTISHADGCDAHVLLGKTAELMVANQHHAMYSLAYRGRVFHGCLTTAATFPVSSTTTPNCILYNPKSNDVNCVLIDFSAGWAAGSNTEGNVMLGVITNAPAAPATGAAIAAFTNATPVNGLLGSGFSSHVRFGTAATIVAATQFLPLGITNLNWISSSDLTFTLSYKFDGSIIVAPGSAVFVCASAASVATYHQRLSWYEFPT
jgi:hypothetical protein